MPWHGPGGAGAPEERAGDAADAVTDSSDSSDRCCWICLGPAAAGAPLAAPCACPRPVHGACLARWQLQQAGRAEERRCRFCGEGYGDWREALGENPGPAGLGLECITPIMAVCVKGRTHKLRVWPGPEGKALFKEQVRELLGLSPSSEFEVVFECKVPRSGEKVQLKGFAAFEAAAHCAAASAARRAARRRERERGAFGGGAAAAAEVAEAAEDEDLAEDEDVAGPAAGAAAAGSAREARRAAAAPGCAWRGTWRGGGALRALRRLLARARRQPGAGGAAQLPPAAQRGGSDASMDTAVYSIPALNGGAAVAAAAEAAPFRLVGAGGAAPAGGGGAAAACGAPAGGGGAAAACGAPAHDVGSLRRLLRLEFADQLID
ncbi:MAG: hypothetical protein J3K34DRAFT_525116 [Monoraphidium minutum]|nr:MAG: hypothetical protein J3K34DRAFT_525116 [Monoraphidium minutum]